MGLKSKILVLLTGMLSFQSCLAQGGERGQGGDMEPTVEIQPAASDWKNYISKLENKRVAVVGNQTSIVQFDNKKTVHLVDFLLEKKINVVKVFSPEHGFRGVADAGAKVNSSIDEVTKLPIVSLYGDNKKPKAEQLKDIDVIVFDLQDVGVRFYTYISTLTYVMEAAAENKVPVIVLDRPNPNIRFVSGPLLKKGFESFVGMHPVPVLYGMTIGEYGKMVNGEKWLKDSVQCDLTVVPVRFYNRHQDYRLPVPPSPNLKTSKAILNYASLCLFEGTTVSVGRGTATPFEVYGHPDFKPGKSSFIPVSMTGATKPLHMNVKCNTGELSPYIYLEGGFILDYLFYAKEQLGDDLKWINSVRFFNLLAGSDQLYSQLKGGKTKEEIVQSWQDDLTAFKQIRAKYLIYR